MRFYHAGSMDRRYNYRLKIILLCRYRIVQYRSIVDVDLVCTFSEQYILDLKNRRDRDEIFIRWTEDIIPIVQYRCVVHVDLGCTFFERWRLESIF